jgi:hypothetical protein
MPRRQSASDILGQAPSQARPAFLSHSGVPLIVELPCQYVNVCRTRDNLPADSVLQLRLPAVLWLGLDAATPNHRLWPDWRCNFVHIMIWTDKAGRWDCGRRDSQRFQTLPHENGAPQASWGSAWVVVDLHSPRGKLTTVQRYSDRLPPLQGRVPVCWVVRESSPGEGPE